MERQATIKSPLHFDGIGLHTGKPVSLDVLPASADHGIVFRRIDLGGNGQGRGPELEASVRNVVSTDLATSLGQDGVELHTVEHILSALYALGVDNALCEVDGPEVPIMDGSGSAFAAMIFENGIVPQDAPRRYLKILNPVEVRDGNRICRMSPAPNFEVTCQIDFPHHMIGEQKLSVDVNPTTYMRDICDARTFGFLDQVRDLQRKGLARGGSLANAVVLDRTGIVNPEGFRFENECVRHKVLDAIGDLGLLGYHLLGRFEGIRSGHALHAALLREVLASPDNFELVEVHHIPVPPIGRAAVSLAYA